MEIILTILFALVAIAAVCALAAVYRKYSASLLKAAAEEQNATHLKEENDKLIQAHNAEIARREEEWRRSMETERKSAFDIREAETKAAADRLADLRSSYEAQLAELKESHEMQLAELKESHRAQIQHERDTLGERFKALATDVLRANSQELDERSRTSIEALLSPMKTSLDEFAKGCRECYDIDSRDRASLLKEIENLQKLNSEVGREANRLTTALKGNTGIQGRWGEMVLANILEHSGLQQSRWFVTQESTSVDNERLRPDAVIHCPKKRDIIIDSKVSLTAYLRMLEADTEEERAALAKAHLASVENHIKTLRDKEYQKKIGAKKGDFVLMFMPHEGAYLTAMHTDHDLWMKAYDSHVIMVSPTHLVTVVHLVEQMWQTEDQTLNSQRIAEAGTKLLDSVTAFLTDMATMGKKIDDVHDCYDKALKRLSTGNNNVSRLARRLGELGLKAKKELPEQFIDDSEDNVPQLEIADIDDSDVDAIPQ